MRHPVRRHDRDRAGQPVHQHPPGLLVNGIVEAMRASRAKVYVCNVATQPGETEGFSVADHIAALERHVGRNFFDVVLANNNFDSVNRGQPRIMSYPPPPTCRHQRYEISTAI